MANPFTPAQAIEPKGKGLFFGATDSGKTYAALSAPGKIAVIDTEGGTAFYAGRKTLSDFDVLQTKSYAELMSALDFLESDEHDYQTLVIDPVTIIYGVLQEAALIRRADMNRKRGRGATTVDEADLEQMDWQRIKRSYTRLMTRLVNLDMHVIVTAREKEESVRDPKTGQFEKTGVYLPDAEKGTAYWFDVVVRMVKTPEGRVGIIEKDRTIEDATVGRRIDKPTFDALFADVLKRKGKGKAKRTVQPDEEAAAKDAAAEEAALHPTDEQIAVLDEWLSAIGADTDRMKRDMNVAGWEELRPEQVEKLTARAKAQAEATKNGTEQKVEAPA